MGANVNTPGDEMFPTVNENGVLYFSSDYHLGMGGLDIFKLNVEPNGKQEAINLKFPINSEADDFGIIFEEGKEEGYFTSTRTEGAKGSDDIWSFVLPPLSFAVDLIVLNAETEKPISETSVKLLGSDGTSFNKITDNEGRLNFKLKEETDYVIATSKERFLNGKENLSTKGYETDNIFAVEIRMPPIEIPIELPNILYDFDDWHLRPESMVALDELVQTLNDNPHITIELSAHTDYVGSLVKNDTLSQRRSQSVVNYLITKGIAADRLVAKGYGESSPKTVNAKLAKEYSFLKEGNMLSEEFIKKLSAQQQEITNQINRRTEFRVLSTDYKQK
jgi:peptidoglycan-associated lipoprotein